MPAATPNGAAGDRHTDRLRPLLAPRSIAVIGATERENYGGRFVRNLQAMGFRGALYPVNPGRDKVFGLPCYAGVQDLPEPVDLAAIIIPAKQVPAAVEACGARGVGAAVIISAGFSEASEEGRALEDGLRAAIARAAPMRVLGPNCLGLANVAAATWPCAPSMLRPGMLEPGPLALVSQSGAIAFGPIIAKCRDRAVGVKHLLSTGNEVDLQVADLIEALAADDDVRAIMVVLESVRDGARFQLAVDAAHARGKRLVVLKLGRSDVGARAAALHTAALTGDDDIYDAFFRQRGIARAADFDELVELAAFFAHAGGANGGGASGVGVISHSGGAAGLAADLVAHAGAPVPDYTPATQEALAAILQGRGSVRNPADITGVMHSARMPEVVRAVAADPEIAALLLVTHGNEAFAERLRSARAEVAQHFAVVWTGRINDPGAHALARAGIPVFSSPRIAAIGLARLLEKPPGTPADAAPDAVREQAVPRALDRLRTVAAATGEGVLDEHASKSVLAELGVAITAERLCRSQSELEDAARAIGFPLALKLALPGVTHKTELGGVRLGIAGPQTLLAAYDEVQARAREHNRAAGPVAVLAQEMVAPLVEVIAGVFRDPVFDAVVLLGLGGTNAEALRLVTWRVAPFDAQEAQAMVDEVPALARLLAGFRGRPAGDRGALVDALVRLSHFARAAGPALQGLDLNPIAVLPRGEGIRVLDAALEPGTGRGRSATRHDRGAAS